MTSRTPLFLALVLASAPEAAHAGGQFVGDNGSQGTQRAGAFVAKADDPTALYYNPANLIHSQNKQLFFGINFVGFEQAFQRSGEYQPQTIDPGEQQPAYVGDPYPRVENRGESQPIPFLAVAGALSRRYAIGIGLFAPHGYGKRDFPTTVRTASSDEAPAPQRYDAVSQTGLIVFPSMGVAMRVSERVNLGVRASWTYAHIQTTKVVQGVPNRGEEPGRDTMATIDVTDPFTLAYALGFHFRKSDSFEMGATYTGPIAMHAVGTSVTTPGEDLVAVAQGGNLIEPVPDAEARCQPGGTPENIKACVDLSLPQTGTVGMRWIARDRRGEEVGDIEVDVRWENWSAASDYRVVIDGRSNVLDAPLNDTVVRQELEDVYSIRAGASTTMVSGDNRFHFRGGAAYDTEASPVNWTSLNVDGGARITLAGGLGISFSSTRLDFGVAHVSSSPRTVREVPVADEGDVTLRQQPDAPVPLLPPDSLPHHPINTGTYESSYTIISAGLTRTW